MEIKCEHCKNEFSDQPNQYPGKVYMHKGEALCEDCLIEMGILPDHAEAEHTHLITESVLYRKVI